MSIPTGFFTDLTKNYYGIDPASQSAEEVEVSAMLWKDFLSKVGTESDPYFAIISSQDEEAVRQALISIASTYMTPLTEEALADIGFLAHELATKRGPALSNLTSKDPVVVKDLLKGLLGHENYFTATVLPSIAEDIATANGEKQKLYLDYLSGRLETTHVAEATVALSMTEVTGRQLVYTLYDIILTLLNIIVTNQILESQSVQPLIRKKEEYVKLMRQLFFYRAKGELDKGLSQLFMSKTAFTGTDPDFQTSNKLLGTEDWMYTEVIFDNDPSKYVLGYAGLTLQDLFTALYNSVAYQRESTGSASFDLCAQPIPIQESSITVGDDTKNTVLYRQTRITISISKDPATGTYTISTVLAEYWRHSDRDCTKWENSWELHTAFPHTQTIIPTSSAIETEALIKNALKTTYYNAYAQGKLYGLVGVEGDYNLWATQYMKDKLGTGNSNLWKYVWLARAYEPKIPWAYIQAAEGKTDVAGILAAKASQNPFPTDLSNATLTLTLQARGEQNKMLNSYLDVIRSKMDLVGDKADSQQQVADTSASARKNTVNILQAVLRQLQNILASIFR